MSLRKQLSGCECKQTVTVLCGFLWSIHKLTTPKSCPNQLEINVLKSATPESREDVKHQKKIDIHDGNTKMNGMEDVVKEVNYAHHATSPLPPIPSKNSINTDPTIQHTATNTQPQVRNFHGSFYFVPAFFF